MYVLRLDSFPVGRIEGRRSRYLFVSMLTRAVRLNSLRVDCACVLCNSEKRQIQKVSPEIISFPVIPSIISAENNAIKMLHYVRLNTFSSLALGAYILAHIYPVRQQNHMPHSIARRRLIYSIHMHAYMYCGLFVCSE